MPRTVQLVRLAGIGAGAVAVIAEEPTLAGFETHYPRRVCARVWNFEVRH